MTFCFHVVVILESLFIGFETREGGPGKGINKRMNIGPNLDYVNPVQENSWENNYHPANTPQRLPTVTE